MNKTDEELIKDYIEGEKAAFTDIVNRYLKPIYNFAYRLVGSQKEAEDISQEVFLKAWKNIEKFDLQKSFKAWIYTIARNTSIDYLRKKKEIPMSAFDEEDGRNVVEDRIVDAEPKADEIFAQTQDKKIIEKVIEELTIYQKEVVILKYVNGMSLREISEIMDMPHDTVKSHHRRALIKMKKMLESGSFGSPNV